MVRALAGNPGVAGSQDGKGAEARFDHPAGAAMNAWGSVFVTDRNGLRMIKADGGVRTLLRAEPFAGPERAALLQPQAVVLDEAKGILYLADSGCIRSVALDGKSGQWVLAGLPGSNPPDLGAFDAVR